MRITKSQLKRIIRESVAGYDSGSNVLSRESGYAVNIFGPGIPVTEHGGEIIIDTGHIQVAEDLYDNWIKVWPDGAIKNNGIIYTGVYI